MVVDINAVQPKSGRNAPEVEPGLWLPARARETAHHGVCLGNPGCLKRLTVGFGLLLSNFRDRLRQWEFSLDGRLSGSRIYPVIRYLNESYLEGARLEES